MKKLLFFVVLIAIASATYAQNWQPDIISIPVSGEVSHSLELKLLEVSKKTAPSINEQVTAITTPAGNISVLRKVVIDKNPWTDDSTIRTDIIYSCIGFEWCYTVGSNQIAPLYMKVGEMVLPDKIPYPDPKELQAMEKVADKIATGKYALKLH